MSTQIGIEEYPLTTPSEGGIEEYPVEEQIYRNPLPTDKAQSPLGQFLHTQVYGGQEEEVARKSRELQGIPPQREITPTQVAGAAMVLPMGIAFIENPIAAGIGLATYTALDKAFNLRNLVPEDARPEVGDVAQALDFAVKGVAMAGGFGAWTKWAPKPLPKPKPQLQLPGPEGRVLEFPLAKERLALPPTGKIYGEAPREQKLLTTPTIESKVELPTIPIEGKVIKPWVGYEVTGTKGDVIQHGVVQMGEDRLNTLRQRPNFRVLAVSDVKPLLSEFTPKETNLPEAKYQPFYTEAPHTPIEEAAKPPETSGLSVVKGEELGIVPPTSPTPTDMYSGIPIQPIVADLGRAANGIGRAAQEFIKQVPLSEKNADMAVDAWYQQGNRGDLLSRFMAEGLQKTIPSLVRRKVITNAMEGNVGVRQLTPVEKATLDTARSSYNQLFEVAKQEGIVKEYIDNYVTHIYSDPLHKVQATLSKWRHGLAKTFKYGKQRTIPTIPEAKALGLHPIEDIGVLLPEYSRQLFRTLSNRRLIDTMKELVDEDGVPLANKPEIARMISELTDPGLTYNKWGGMWRSFRGGVKRAIMLNPAVHGWNMFSVVVNETNFSIPKAIGVMREGGKLWGGQDKVLMEMADNGLNIGGHIGVELRERIYHSPDPDAQGIFAEWGHGLGRMKDWSDRVLWDGIVRNGMVGLYQLEKSRLLKGGKLSDKEAGRAASHVINDFMGMLPNHWMTAFERSAGSHLLLARNWTYSNLRMLTGAMGKYSQVKGMKNFLRHKALSPDQLSATQKIYLSHLVKGVFGLLMYSNLLQLGALSLRAKREGKTLAEGWRDGSIHMTWENEGNKKFDIDTGVRAKDGAPLYLVNPLFRYIRDYMGWVTDPARTLYNKAEPVLKSSLEALINYEPWRRKAVTEREGIVGMVDKLEHAGMGMTPWRQTAEPGMGIALEPKRVLTPLERFAPLAGTWTTRGLIYPSLTLKEMSRRDKEEFALTLSPSELTQLRHMVRQGRISGDIAHKLMKFRKEQLGRMDVVDERIDLLLQQGRKQDAIDLMRQSRRYTSIEGFRGRLLKFKQRTQK